MKYQMFFLILTFLCALSRADSQFCDTQCKTESNITDLAEVCFYSSSVERLQSLKRDIRFIHNSNEIKFNENVRYFRDLRDFPDYKLPKTTQDFFNDVSIDLNALSEVITGIESYTRSLSKILPQQRVDVEDKIRVLQKAKFGILLRQPLLISENIKIFLLNKAKKDDFTAIPREQQKNLIIKALSDNLILQQQEQYKLQEFINDPLAPQISGNLDADTKKINSYLSNFPDKFPYVTEKLLHYKASQISHLSTNEKKDLCFFDTSLASQKKWNDRLKMAGDAAAIGVSFVAGPLGRGMLLATGLERAKLIEWGLTAGSESYLVASSFVEYNNTISVCNGSYLNYTREPSLRELNTLTQCHEKLSSDLIKSALAATAGGLPYLAKLPLLKAPHISPNRVIDVTFDSTAVTRKMKENGAVRYSNTNGEFTIFDLGRKDLAEQERLNSLSEKYLTYVSDEYKKRLNLSSGEIDSFMQTSRAYKDRTTYIVSTKSTSPEEIQGGVALVTSHKPADLLPLEKATGLRLDRSEGGVAEIVRLTTSKTSPRAVTEELLEQITKLMLANPSLQTIYIYTSKVHARMYKRYGIFVKEDRTLPGDRDVLLRININDLRLIKDSN